MLQILCPLCMCYLPSFMVHMFSRLAAQATKNIFETTYIGYVNNYLLSFTLTFNFCITKHKMQSIDLLYTLSPDSTNFTVFVGSEINIFTLTNVRVMQG